MLYFRFLHAPEALEREPEAIGQFVMTETNGEVWFYSQFDSPAEAERFFNTSDFLKYEAVDLKDYIDWGVQWAEHAPGFQDYSLHIALSKYVPENQKSLTLKAGPGFGDLSHPTTRLMLELMASDVKERAVIDVGCGSGILTLAALLLGAKQACGLDIDAAALAHARENAALNGLTATFCQPYELPDIFPDALILMNMIRTEQTEAWNSLAQLHSLKALCITSGILATEKELYLKECQTRGWRLLHAQQQGDWMAFKFAQG